MESKTVIIQAMKNRRCWKVLEYMESILKNSNSQNFSEKSPGLRETRYERIRLLTQVLFSQLRKNKAIGQITVTVCMLALLKGSGNEAQQVYPDRKYQCRANSWVRIWNP